MLTIETERRVARFFSEISRREFSSQQAKLNLITNSQFNPYQCFRALDVERHNKIDPYDIVAFMKKNRKYITLHEAKFIILFYSPEHVEYLSYANFVAMLLSGYESYSMMTDFKVYDNPELEIDRLDATIESLLMDVLEKEIELIRSCQNYVDEIRKRYDFDITDMFNSIAKSNNISITYMRDFLTRNGIYFSDDNIMRIITRLSIDKNGYISLYEMKTIFENGFCNDTKKEITESMLRCRGGSTGFGYEKNEPNKYLTVENLTKASLGHNERIPGSMVSIREAIGDNRITQISNNIGVKIDKEETFNRVSEAEEGKFVDLLKKILDTEMAIENAKCELTLRSDFNIEDTFRIFESNNQGYLTEKDLAYGLEALSLKFEEDEIRLLMHKYDLRGQGVLQFNNFFDMLVPFTKYYRSMIESRIQMEYTPKYNKSDIFLASTRLYLQNLFRLIMSTEKEIEKIRRENSSMLTLYLKTFYAKIDKENNGFVGPKQIGSYLKIHNKIIVESEADLLFIRLDRDRDGKVTINDLYLEITPLNREEKK